MYYCDAPINSFNDDLLHRAEFAKRLATSILSIGQTEGFTIAVYGEWGSGKTSILNMAKEEISRQTKALADSDKPLIIDFNPWHFTSREQLYSQFFRLLGERMGQDINGAKMKKAGKDLQDYASSLDLLSWIPGASGIVKVVKSILGSAGVALQASGESEQKSTDQLREVVSRQLREQKQKIVLFVDDMDRLEAADISAVFQLVSAVAGFPSMVFVLSFDKAIVEKALETIHLRNGLIYLEKIVQLGFDIPQATSSDIQDVLLSRMDAIISADKITLTAYGNDVFDHCIFPYVKSMRDVNRYVNLFEFQYHAMKREVNCFDLLAITALQVFDPRLHQWIRENKEYVAGRSFHFALANKSREENKRDMTSRLESIYEGLGNSHVKVEMATDALSTLFPCICRIVKDYYDYADNADSLFRERRIACPDKFDLYFSFSLPDDAIPAGDIEALTNTLSSDGIVEYIDRAIRSKRIAALMREIKCRAELIPKERIAQIAKAFADVQYTLEGSMTFHLFPSSYSYLCGNLLERLFSEIPSENERAQLIHAIINDRNPNTIAAACALLIYASRPYGRLGLQKNNHPKLLDEGCLCALEGAFLATISYIVQIGCIFDMKGYALFEHVWKRLDEDGCQAYVEELLKDATNIPKYLTQKNAQWSDGSWDFFTSGEWFVSQYTVFDRIRELSQEEIAGYSDNDLEIMVAFYAQAKEKFAQTEKACLMDAYLGK